MCTYMYTYLYLYGYQVALIGDASIVYQANKRRKISPPDEGERGREEGMERVVREVEGEEEREEGELIEETEVKRKRGNDRETGFTPFSYQGVDFRDYAKGACSTPTHPMPFFLLPVIPSLFHLPGGLLLSSRAFQTSGCVPALLCTEGEAVWPSVEASHEIRREESYLHH